MALTSFKGYGSTDAAKAVLTAWLTADVELQERMGCDHVSGLSYANMTEFVLRHGAWCNPQPLPRGYKLATPRQCFGNSQELVMRPDGLTYYEGFALNPRFPVHHGWCCDRWGNVVDVTWDWTRYGATEHRAGEVAYLGVPFPLEVVLQSRIISGFTTVLDMWEYRWPILQQPFDPEAPGAWLDILTEAAKKRRARGNTVKPRECEPQAATS